MTLKELRTLACKQDVQVKELRAGITKLKSMDTSEDSGRRRPIDFKKGDSYYNHYLEHHVTLIKEIDGEWWAISTTSTETCSTSTGIEVKQRFSDKKTWYTKTILAVNPKEMQFKGIADTYNLNKALRLIRKSLIKI